MTSALVVMANLRKIAIHIYSFLNEGLNKVNIYLIFKDLVTRFTLRCLFER